MDGSSSLVGKIVFRTDRQYAPILVDVTAAVQVMPLR